MPDDIYCYPGSNVLKNKMGIRDTKRLHVLERKLLHNGYVISFANTNKEEMLEASKESFLCEYGAMERLFRKCLRKR